MKKLFAVLLAAAIIICLLAGCKSGAETVEPPAPTDGSLETGTPVETEAPTAAPEADYSKWRVALLTETPEIVEGSRDRVLCDAGEAWCEARGVGFVSRGAADISYASLEALIVTAIEDGYNTLILPGWTLVDAIKKTAAKYPDVRFILIDVTANFGKDYVYPANMCNAVFQEHILGFMAGYAAVKLGYRHLSFVGAKNTAPIIRYGYGYVQGASAAAVELDVAKEIAVDYVYANTLAAEPSVTAYVEALFEKKGVELCFVCGGEIKSAACDAAQRVESVRLIGADTELAPLVNDSDGGNAVVTSAVKNYAVYLQTVLQDIVERRLWSSYSGKTASLGLVSGDDPDVNYIKLAASTQFIDGKFSKEDYAALVEALFAGEYEISDETKKAPDVVIAANYFGNIR